MKKIYKGLIAGFALTGAFLFTGCDIILDMLEGSDGTGRGYEIVQATESDEWEYDSTYPIYPIGPTVKTFTITKIPSGKKIYLVKRNVSDTHKVAADDTRWVTFNGGRSVVNNEVLPEITAPESKYKHFVPEEIAGIIPSASRSAVTGPSLSVTPVSGTIGSTKKIWVELKNKGYVQADATLRAKGANCYVWVVNDFYTTGTASGNKVDSSIAQKYADNFELIYPFITNIFGNESEIIINAETGKPESIGTLSDTGSKINIVVYDIKDDGVLGFFYAKDYYYGPNYQGQDIIRKSNVGKYFYIDSAYAVSEFPSTISTLAHEFQHMVNYNQKTILHGEFPSVAYNEMLSMLCEDMMMSKLGLTGKTDSPKDRIQSFNALYFGAAINGYNNEKNTSLYYSTNYAFGAWLARQYGGAELVKAMSTNDSVDYDSMVDAVNSVNHYTGSNAKDFEDLFQEFVLSLTGSSTYTMNKNAKQTITYSGYSYPMTAINLWDDVYAPENIPDFKATYSKAAYADYNYKGPFILNYNYGYALQPDNGISIHCLGSTTTGSKTFTFSDGAECIGMYVIIQ